jgi:hypothetical protein
MRINDLLTENQQLDEGPLGTVGKAIGKGVGGLAKGVGAVAGGIAGIGGALKKGYQTGKATVAGQPDPNAEPEAPATKPTAGAAPTQAAPTQAAPTQAAPTQAAPAAAAGTAPTAQQINKAGPKGTAPAKTQTGAAGQALAKTTAVVDKAQAQSQEKANQTVYAQVKANIDNLDKKGKQRILQLLQKAVAAPAPKPAAGAAAATTTAAAPAAEPAAEPAATPAAATTTAAAPAAEPAATPAAATTAAAPAAEPAATPAAATTPPATKARGGKVAGQQSQTPNAIRKRNARRDKANAAATTGGAGAFNQMAQQMSQQNSSKDNYGTALTEMLADRVAIHKQRMFEANLINGTASVFKK